MNTSRRQYIPVICLLAVMLVTGLLYDHSAPYDNAASRFDLAFSLALDGQLDIDKYHTNTVDKAIFEGHYYSDKAPGISLAAVPVIYTLSRIFPRTAWHPDNPAARYPVTILIILIPSALALLVMIRISKILTGADNLFPILVYGAGSLAFTYSTLFYSHQFCAVLLILLFYLWISELSGEKESTFARGIISGFLAGYASISEYTVAVPAGLILLMMVIRSRKLSHVAGIITGVAIPMLILGFYNNAAFGNPFHIGYMFEAHPWFREEMSKGVGGVTAPDAANFMKLLFAPQRGLLWGHAFFILAIPGTVILWKEKNWKKTAGILTLAIFAISLLINASYYEPFGGFSPGPRFLVWSLPFLTILALTAWNISSTPVKSVFAGAGIFYIIYYQLITAIEPHVPHVFQSPLFQFTLPLIRAGYSLEGYNLLFSGGLKPLILPLALVLTGSAVLIKHDNIEKIGASKLFSIAAGFVLIAGIMAGTASLVPPPPAKSSYYIGSALNVNHKYGAAAEYFETAVIKRPVFPQAWFGLGIALMKSGQYNEAVTCFEKSLSQDPGSLQTRVSLSALLMALDRKDEAAVYIEEGLKMYPGDARLEQLLKKQ